MITLHPLPLFQESHNQKGKIPSSPLESLVVFLYKKSLLRPSNPFHCLDMLDICV
jgi:hypothetical protein